ncbi:MAG TPA: L,D-transpeptidase [Vicinamibacteria bacterium]
MAIGRERWKGVLLRVGSGVHGDRNRDRGTREIASRWRELRDAYPRIVTGMVLGIAVLLLLTDVVLAYKRLRNEDIAKLYAMVPVGTPVYIY